MGLIGRGCSPVSLAAIVYGLPAGVVLSAMRFGPVTGRRSGFYLIVEINRAFGAVTFLTKYSLVYARFTFMIFQV